MPGGKAKKLKEAADCASASPLEMKGNKSAEMKTKTKKPDEKAAAAAADLASPSLLHDSKTKRGNQEEKSQIEEIPSSSEVQSPSFYLVVRHAVACPAYSVYRIKHALASADHPLPVPSRVKYLDAEHGMSFAAVSSRRRSWIVGVGGFSGHRDGRGQTIVFDCNTRLVAKGPRPTASKSEPVLFVVGEKVYALSRMPNVWRLPDYAPWFEVLDLSDASCVDGKLTGCA
ncbi:unnamed protein product [Urochloa humidicola]